MKPASTVLIAVLSVAHAMSLSAQQAAPAKTQSVAAGLSAETRQKLVESLRKGAAFLSQKQRPDGMWENHPGITAMAATALLRQPGPTARSRSADGQARRSTALAKLAKPDGGIYEKDIPHYITAVSMMAFVAGGRAQDKPLIEKGRRYLADHLSTKAKACRRATSSTAASATAARATAGEPTSSASSTALRAMKEAELPANDAAWDKAIKFLQRTQNNSETNDQTWATNDGGFIYYPGLQPGAARRRPTARPATPAHELHLGEREEDRPARAGGAEVGPRQLHGRREPRASGRRRSTTTTWCSRRRCRRWASRSIVDAKGRRHNWREDLGRSCSRCSTPRATG